MHVDGVDRVEEADGVDIWGEDTVSSTKENPLVDEDGSGETEAGCAGGDAELEADGTAALLMGSSGDLQLSFFKWYCSRLLWRKKLSLTKDFMLIS